MERRASAVTQSIYIYIPIGSYCIRSRHIHIIIKINSRAFDSCVCVFYYAYYNMILCHCIVTVFSANIRLRTARFDFILYYVFIIYYLLWSPRRIASQPQ